jgi:hypothetical protein
MHKLRLTRDRSRYDHTGQLLQVCEIGCYRYARDNNVRITLDYTKDPSFIYVYILDLKTRNHDKFLINLKRSRLLGSTIALLHEYINDQPRRDLVEKQCTDAIKKNKFITVQHKENVCFEREQAEAKTTVIRSLIHLQDIQTVLMDTDTNSIQIVRNA